MLISRRTFLAQSAAATGSATGLLIFPAALRAQHWANCQSGKQVAAFRQVNANTKVAQFSDWHEGDCEMQGATITLNSNGNCRFSAQVCTHFTHSKDIWHFYVEIAGTSNGANAYTQYSWDGPKMSEQDHPLFHPWQVNFRLPGGTFSKAAFARAMSCC